MSFSFEPATAPPPSLDVRLSSALRIISDAAELERQKLARNIHDSVIQPFFELRDPVRLKSGRGSIWSLRNLASLRLCVKPFFWREALTQSRKVTKLRKGTDMERLLMKMVEVQILV